MRNPLSGVMLKTGDAPQLATENPAFEIVPPAPAEALMVKGIKENVALIVWLLERLLNVYDESGPKAVPSTKTFER